MYYPYVRGRQFELIALREMLEKDLLGPHVIPIIEPVKASSTLLSVLQGFSKSERKIGLIKNPKVGNFIAEVKKNKEYRKSYNGYSLEGNCIPIYISDTEIISEIQESDQNNKPILICTNKDFIQQHIAGLQDKIGSIFIPDESIFKRNTTSGRVIFCDRFNKKTRNVEYKDIEDEFFSDDHRYFRNEGYIGFSDFSTIGDEYNESGFAPYAVVIHMVYFDKEKNLRIHHFVSDTNDDYSDPAGKFAEALKKLVDSPLLSNCPTYAYNTYKDLNSRREYPGLGSVKKLSLMHHVELISKYLENQD
jgi:hypothetical protein